MPDKSNRRELILDTASQLFLTQGYNATSVRQIAGAVGCTEAALYYHFKDGKRALLQAVIECNMPDLMSALDDCEGAQTLYELVKRYGEAVVKTGPARLERIRWLIAEFPQFSPEERDLFHRKHLRFHERLTGLIEPFTASPQEADQLAWMLTCTSFGYGQLFYNLDLQSVADFPPEVYIEQLARTLSAGHEPIR